MLENPPFTLNMNKLIHKQVIACESHTASWGSGQDVFWAAVQPGRLSCGQQLFPGNNNRKGNWKKKKEKWKKKKAFKDVGVKHKTRERRKHVHTYLIHPNFSAALWLNKSLHCAGCVVSRRYKLASNTPRETGELNKDDRNAFRERQRF